MSFRSTMSSPKATRRLLWIGSIVIAVAVAAAVVVLVGDTGTARPEVIEQEPAIVSQEGPKAPLPREARKVAGEFILTAVNRKNLERGWQLTHPTLREGMTKKEWLTGNIPVVPYPVSDTEPAPMSVEESYADSAIMRVALAPQQGSDVKPQIFFIGVRKFQGHWLVDYWGPYSTVPVPSANQ